MKAQEMLRKHLLPQFNNLTSFVFAIILLFLMIGILIGTGKLFLQLGDLLNDGKITGSYLNIITDVLSLFILIELSRSLADYFEVNRLRLTSILDAVIVFVLREIMIQLFQHKLPPEEIYAISALLLVLGILRIASALVFLRGQAAEAKSVTPQG
jgi:uncharacterized membrane protein (DUF373 family)